jgi:hypothetical protein
MLNARSGDPGFDGYLSHGDLEAYFKAIKANHKLLILDVCYGGSFDQNKIAAMKAGGPDESLPKDKFISQHLKMSSAEFLASGKLQKVSDGQPGEHSPFAREILRSLRKENRRYGVLTFPRLYDEISHVKPGPHRGDLYNTSGDFLFIQQ